MKYTKGKTKNLSNNTFLTSKNKNKLVYTGGRYYRKTRYYLINKLKRQNQIYN